MRNEVNDFFNNNYNDLLAICADYSNRYNYTKLGNDELVSELLLYTVQSHKRTNKLLSLIRLSAATTNYNYSSVAMYYIISIIYRITFSQRSFLNNLNKDKLKLIYSPDLSYHIIDESREIQDIDYLTKADVFSIAETVSHRDENWWKYRVWLDKFGADMTYAQLSKKYQLSTTPLFHIVKEFNQVLSRELTVVATHKAYQAGLRLQQYQD